MWSTAHQLSDEQREDLLYFIPRMDKVYLDFKAKKLKDALNSGNG